MQQFHLVLGFAALDAVAVEHRHAHLSVDAQVGFFLTSSDHNFDGFFFSSRRRHTSSVSAFLLNRSSDLVINIKLMDELAQCYNVLPQLDINNTIDHRPEGDEKIGRASCRERV